MPVPLKSHLAQAAALGLPGGTPSRSTSQNAWKALPVVSFGGEPSWQPAWEGWEGSLMEDMPSTYAFQPARFSP
jgi:hypothetical protein